MIDTYLKLALDEEPNIIDKFDYSEKYLIRSLGGGINAELALKALLLEFQAAIEG